MLNSFKNHAFSIVECVGFTYLSSFITNNDVAMNTKERLRFTLLGAFTMYYLPILLKNLFLTHELFPSIDKDLKERRKIEEVNVDETVDNDVFYKYKESENATENKENEENENTNAN